MLYELWILSLHAAVFSAPQILFSMADVKFVITILVRND